MNPFSTLQSRYPFPAAPVVEPLVHGWGTHEVCFDRLLAGIKSPLIVEVGAWMGKMSLIFLERYPGSRLVAIDTWLGSLEHQPGKQHWHERLPVLYETFVANLWEKRDRVAAVREQSKVGMELCGEIGLRPDLVYIDASHLYHDVLSDIETACRVFPEAIICGDDCAKDNGVRRALTEFLARKRARCTVTGRFWKLEAP